MSSPSFRLVVSDYAKRDINDILRYTLENWGNRQLDAYKTLLDATLRKIGHNPQAGRDTNISGKDVRVWPVGSHRIFYYISGEVINILRILHERMDVTRHLQELPSSLQESASVAFRAKAG